jgi:hypothetical protein
MRPLGSLVQADSRATFSVAIHLEMIDAARMIAGGLAARTGDVGSLARWLRSDQAKALEQEALDPKAPIARHGDATGCLR